MLLRKPFLIRFKSRLKHFLHDEKGFGHPPGILYILVLALIVLYAAGYVMQKTVFFADMPNVLWILICVVSGLIIAIGIFYELEKLDLGFFNGRSESSFRDEITQKERAVIGKKIRRVSYIMPKQEQDFIRAEKSFFFLHALTCGIEFKNDTIFTFILAHEECPSDCFIDLKHDQLSQDVFSQGYFQIIDMTDDDMWKPVANAAIENKGARKNRRGYVFSFEGEAKRAIDIDELDNLVGEWACFDGVVALVICGDKNPMCENN